MKNSAPVQALLDWSKRTSLPGFFGICIYEVFEFIRAELRRYDLITRANSVAFSLFLSLFPALLMVFSLIPLLKDYLLNRIPGGENFDQILNTEINRIMPGIVGDRLIAFIQDITENPRVGLLSFGFITSLFFASNGVIAIMRGFNKTYHLTFKKRTWYKKRLIAILLTFQLGLLLITSVLLIILGRELIGLLDAQLGLDVLAQLGLKALRWLAIIALFYTSISIIYRRGAPTRRKFRFFSPGAALATLLCLFASLGFSIYVDRFNTYNELYGSIGAIIVLLLWLQINVFAIFIGFELNAGIAVRRDLQSGSE